MSDKSYITPEGHRRLREELDKLWKVERPRVTHEVSLAAAQGDRSENAEYIYGKKRLREIDSRLRNLTKRLDEVEVVHTAPERRDKVYFGAWVTLEDEAGEVVHYRIGGPDESDATRGAISMHSPIGRALMGRQLDDEVLVQRPKGPTGYTVLEIRYDEEDGEG